MTTPNLDFHPRAIEEARAARRWHARRSTLLANQFTLALDEAVKEITVAPALWSPHLHGTRCHRLKRFSYLIIYRETIGSIQIIAVAHTRRRPGYWRRRVG